MGRGTVNPVIVLNLKIYSFRYWSATLLPVLDIESVVRHTHHTVDEKLKRLVTYYVKHNLFCSFSL